MSLLLPHISLSCCKSLCCLFNNTFFLISAYTHNTHTQGVLVLPRDRWGSTCSGLHGGYQGRCLRLRAGHGRSTRMPCTPSVLTRNLHPASIFTAVVSTLNTLCVGHGQAIAVSGRSARMRTHTLPAHPLSVCLCKHLSRMPRALKQCLNPS